MAKGALKIQCFSGTNTYVPVGKCKITITQTEQDGTALRKSNVIYTDSSGLTEEIELDAPGIENSQEPGKTPYSFADILIEKESYNPILIKGVQIYPDRVALQQTDLKLESRNQNGRGEEVIDIGSNVLVGNYPAKIPEAEEKDLPPPQGTVVLPAPVVPEYITVHAGSPNDASAPNYKVDYKSYIKNVASCEIYATWSENTIRANVYAIISFTLNRIYTEWYKGKGKRFDITNSTAYDHAFNYGRNIYDNIGRIVDEIFSTYMKRFEAKQPLLTQYCDGIKVKCPGWMTQWG
ncbi:MAG: spore cortex-lytic protein, partial [Sarcina sp.]